MNRKRIAKKLARAYQAHVMQVSMLNRTNGRRTHTKFADLGETDRKHFLKCADVCIAVDAKPKDYIIAQFKAFQRYSTFAGRVLMPMPSQLHSLGAQLRYAQFCQEEHEHQARSANVAEKAVQGHYREDRKLAGLVRITRMNPEDILTERPEEFSPAYLKAKGVWNLVEDIYHERVAS